MALLIFALAIMPTLAMGLSSSNAVLTLVICIPVGIGFLILAIWFPTMRYEMACFVHGALTAIIVIGIYRGGKYLLSGYLAALGLHLFLNAPTAMYQLQWISFELYNFSLVIPFIILAVIFERMRRQARVPKDDPSGNEVVYWQRHVTEDQSL